jgi:vancomycin resistance protein YoaR
MSAAVYQMKQAKKTKTSKKHLELILKTVFWFIIGATFAAILFSSFAFFMFKRINYNVVYPGISVDDIDLGKYTEDQVKELFAKKNQAIENTLFTFSFDSIIATISAKNLEFGYDSDLISKQVISLGRSSNFFSNISIILQAYFNKLDLQPAYRYSEDALSEILAPFIKNVNKDPVNALFNFENGKVLGFKPSEDGKTINTEKVKKDLSSYFKTILLKQKPQNITIPIAAKTILPKITTEKANNLGIKELIGKGTSLFQHSIQSRIFNVNLAASRINGALIAPNEIFSFDKTLGDVSAFTGYQQAYIIQNGKTVLGDGGGVCQVSTTFFRALLNAGLPITERHAHAYRVGYYEQDSPPGLDATVYVPSVDLKFRNDTNHYILVQTQIDPNILQLSIFLYGTSDGRSITLTQPVITSRTPAPADSYQNDPTLPKGTIKQIDFSADGARVVFTREVIKNGKKIISENFISNYAPWQSVFLRGTKE